MNRPTLSVVSADGAPVPVPDAAAQERIDDMLEQHDALREAIASGEIVGVVCVLGHDPARLAPGDRSITFSTHGMTGSTNMLGGLDVAAAMIRDELMYASIVDLDDVDIDPDDEL